MAAGIGGGSADAAAALRLILAACGAEIDDAALGEAALKIGADVPVCLHSRASRVTGIGGSVELLEDFPELDAVLVNPRVAVPTAQVFAALNIDPGTTLARPSLAAIVREAGPREVLAAIRDGGNDLQAAACALCPQIGACLGALDGAGAALSRMSGSGATCFGLYDDEQAAARAAAAIAADHPGWWVRPVRLS